MANITLREIGEVDPETVNEGVYPARRVSITRFEDTMTLRQNWAALYPVAYGRYRQSVSQSLLCLRVNEFHGRKAVQPLITSVTHAMLDKWLTGDPAQGYQSVFERFDSTAPVPWREPSGEIPAVTSHMCRHLFTTNALTAGATIIDVARWQGREHLGDIAAYDQRSAAEKVAMVKDAIRTERLQGQVAQTYLRMAEDIRDEWLDGQVLGMHATPLGLCVHDYTTTPCVKALNCLKNCGDYLHDPCDPKQRQTLVQLERRTREVLVRMEPLEREGKLAASWAAEQRDTLRTVQALLEINPDTARGPVFPFRQTSSEAKD